MTAQGPPARDVFARARLRLGVLFLVIVVVLVSASSLVIYLSFRSDLRQLAALRTGGDTASHETEQELVNRSLVSFRWQLLALDGAIILVVGVGGLLYARSTLRPIRDNVAAQKRFIADASHDLRTPLAVMKTEFEVALRDPELPEAVRPLLGDGLEEVDHMAAMVDDLLTLSRIDARQETLARERVDLAALAAEAVAKFEKLAAGAGVVLVLDAPRPVPADGDARHLRRALGNLVRNAIEHSPGGGRVTVEAAAVGGTTLLAVQDEGPGIAPEDLAHVFDRFYSADPSRSREQGGSGLGLAIARWAVRQMSGDITAESTPGRGTRMTVSLLTPRS